MEKSENTGFDRQRWCARIGAPLALLMLLCACAGGPVITRVDQTALFRPSLVHYGAVNDTLLLQIHGAPLPAGTDRAQLADAMVLPGRYHPIRFVLDDSVDAATEAATDGATDTVGDTFTGRIRMVLVVNPGPIPLAQTVCREPGEITGASGAQLNIMAVLCAGNRYAAKGNVQVRAGAVTPQDIAADLRGLFADMLYRSGKLPHNIIFAHDGSLRARGISCLQMC